MSDDYTIHIKASVDDSGGGGGNTPSPSNEAVDEAKMRQKVLEELFKDNVFSTEPSEPANKKRGRGRPKKESTDTPKEEKEEKREKSPAEDMLEKLKSFVAIFDGHNGRITKVLNGVHRTVTAWQNTIHKAGQAAQTTAQATATAGQAAQTAATATAAAGTTAASFGAAIASTLSKLGPVGIALAVLATVAIATVVGLKAINAALEAAKERVGQFSAAVEVAKAREQVASIQRQIKSAGQIGGEVAALQTGMTEITNTLNDMWTNFYDLAYPVFKVGLSAINGILKAINALLVVANAISDVIEVVFEKMLELLSYLPFIGGAAGKMLEWMRQDQISKAEENSLNIQIENAFSSDSLNINQRNNPIESRFL